MKLKIEYVSIDELKPYAGNAKLHPAEQIDQIIKSIEQFGMNDPIAVWKDNEIIEGHGRLIALKEMGEERLKELGIDRIPIVRLDELTDNQRKAYALVHNKLTMNSGWEYSLLDMEIESIESIVMRDYGFDLTNIDLDGIDDIFTDTETEKKKKTVTCPCCGKEVEI